VEPKRQLSLPQSLNVGCLKLSFASLTSEITGPKCLISLWNPNQKFKWWYIQRTLCHDKSLLFYYQILQLVFSILKSSTHKRLGNEVEILKYHLNIVPITTVQVVK